MGYRISDADYVFSSGKAIKVTHPDHYDINVSWYFREDGSYLNWQDGVIYKDNLDRETIEHIANHDKNEFEVVKAEESPFQ